MRIIGPKKKTPHFTPPVKYFNNLANPKVSIPPEIEKQYPVGQITAFDLQIYHGMEEIDVWIKNGSCDTWKKRGSSWRRD